MRKQNYLLTAAVLVLVSIIWFLSRITHYVGIITGVVPVEWVSVPLAFVFFFWGLLAPADHPKSCSASPRELEPKTVAESPMVDRTAMLAVEREERRKKALWCVALLCFGYLTAVALGVLGALGDKTREALDNHWPLVILTSAASVCIALTSVSMAELRKE